jgi:hypothetical protein
MRVFIGKNKGWYKGFTNSPKQKGYEPSLGSFGSMRGVKKTKNKKGGINLLG